MYKDKHTGAWLTKEKRPLWIKDLNGSLAAAQALMDDVAIDLRYVGLEVHDRSHSPWIAIVGFRDATKPEIKTYNACVDQGVILVPSVRIRGDKGLSYAD